MLPRCHHLSVLVLLIASLLARGEDAWKLDFAQYLQGKDVFERNCMICHGARGDGEGELSKGLIPKPRSFREGLFKFRSTPFGALPTDDDLRRTVRGGLTNTAMGMFTQLGEEDVGAVIEYVKSFSRRWRKADNYAPALVLPETPKWFGEDGSRREHAVAGKVLFNNVCATCHGAEADGKGPTAPALTDAWKLPCKPADLRQPHLRCGDAPGDVYRLLSTGMNGTPMISYEGALTPAQRWDIIAYISTLKLPDVPNLGGAPKPGR